MFLPLEIRSGLFNTLKSESLALLVVVGVSPNCCDLEEDVLGNMCALCIELVKRGKGVFAVAFCRRKSEILISRVLFQNCVLEVGQKRHLCVVTSPKLQIKETIMWSLVFQNCLCNCLAFGPPAEKWCQ